MNRNFAAVLIAIVVCGAGVSLGAALSPDEQSLFEKQAMKLMKLEPEKLAAAPLGKVFAATFYKVKVDVGGSQGEMLAAKLGEELMQVTLPTSTADMPELQKVVKPGFVIKSTADAKNFEQALDVLYPITTTFNQDDVKAKAIQHKGDEWIFVRGKFFDDLKGFVVKTDAKGAVVEVKWSLEIKK